MTAWAAKGIPLDTVKTDILPDYDCYPLVVEPADAGHAGVSRERVYMFCVHHETGVYLHDVYAMYASISKLIRQTVATEVQDRLFKRLSM